MALVDPGPAARTRALRLLRPDDTPRPSLAVPAAGDGAAAPSTVVLVVPPPVPEPRLEWVWVMHRGRGVPVRVQDVDWIGAEDNYIRLHAGAESYLIRETLTAFGARLDPRRFARVHRSRIVNLARIREIHPWSAGALLLVMHDGTEIRVSRGCRRALGDVIGQYL